MNNLIILICLLFSFSLYAHDNDKGKHKGHDKHHHEPSVFEVIPLNSPVKESTVKFLLKVPSGFDIDKIKYKIKNASHLFEKDKPHQDINLVNGPQGKELHVPISKLPPGFYQIFVKVIDKKKKEHDFKTKYKDYAMFTIDETLEVPFPDPKIDDATIAGVDSDNDGIPDRVQRWINETYSSQPKVKLAMKQIARARQLNLMSVGDKQQSIISSRKMLDSRGCLRFLVGTDELIKQDAKMRGKFFNTKDRLYAEIQASQNFSGQIYPLSKEPSTLCDFDLNN